MNTRKFFRLSNWSQTWSEISIKDRRWFGILLLAHVFLTLWLAWSQPLMNDESDYLGYVVRWGKGHPERTGIMDDSKTPLVFPALAGVVVRPFMPNATALDKSIMVLRVGRCFMYVYLLAGAFILWLWMHRLCGPGKWRWPLLLFLFDPLVISYSMMVGSDLPSAVTVLLVAYAAWRFVLTHQKKYWWLVCGAVSWGLVLKSSLLFLIPMLALLLLLWRVWNQERFTRQLMLQIVQRWILLALSCWGFICIAYYGRHLFMPVDALPGHSSSFLYLKQWLQPFGWLRIPLPMDYVSGFDWLLYNAQHGGGIGNEYSFVGVGLLDQYFVKGPLWYYYLVCFALKMPLLIWFFTIVSVVLLGAVKNKTALFRRYLFVWFPALFFLLLLSLNNPFQIGIRHAILILPFWYLMIAKAIQWWQQHYKKLWLCFISLHFVSLAFCWPFLPSYTNELIWDKKMVYRYLFDSSIDYTNCEVEKKFLKEHPEYRTPPDTPAAGKFALHVSYLNYWPKDSAYGNFWLYKHFTPSGQYKRVVLFFEITENDLKKKGLMH